MVICMIDKIRSTVTVAVTKILKSGDVTDFWHDDWLGTGCLRGAFYRLYNLSRQKWNCVNTLGSWEHGRWHWKFLWRRPLVGRELEWEKGLLDALGTVQLTKGVPDAWVWMPSNVGIYSVNSAYHFLQEPTLPDTDEALVSIWHSFAPSNVKGFAWRVLLDRFASRENLLKRQVITSLADAQCALCNDYVETGFHLLFSCTFSLSVWQGCLHWLGCSFIQPSSARDHLSHFRFGINKLQQRLALSIWLAVIWSVWLARNEVVFRGGAANIDSVLELVKRRSWQWNKANMKGFSYSSSDWFSNPLLCILGT
ncbi:uncharacterized protein LOC130713229 [Lotus japonicus]|uniref:uncharacterized protein LOC130713229 n=1 Tax=Lotus japonicus TaxID=34305 RepID=UPI00258E7844|nr:uncharacterized protein LOC130713229 [Lotus japonicus]